MELGFAELAVQEANTGLASRSMSAVSTATIATASGLAFAVPATGSVADQQRKVQLVLKRLVDLGVASFALLLLAPLLFLVAVAIKVSSPGPVVFVQPRLGRDGTVFQIFKFRTMFAHLEDRTGATQTVPGDFRVTPLGRWLRKTSVDELPQLLNVMRGDMSLVGPRPHAVGMTVLGQPYEDLVPYYYARLAVRPGLTGWAQANGYRGPTLTLEAATSRIQHDLAYIQNFSLTLDLLILAKTVRSEFFTGSGL